MFFSFERLGKIALGVTMGVGMLAPGLAHAAGSATVTLGGQQYSISDVTCASGAGWFKLQGKGSSGAGLMELAAVSGEVNSVGFRVGDTMAQVADQTGTLSNGTFNFEGDAQVFTLNSINRQVLRVTINCANG